MISTTAPAPGVRSGPAPRPITAHHLFPAMVALWFAALFSLSTLAVRTELFEQMVIAAHVDRIVPAAAPPLGHTARLMIAVLFGLVGAGLGLVIARIVAGAGRAPALTDSHAEDFAEEVEDFRLRPRDAHPDAPARRPISARDELGVDEFDAPFPTAPLTARAARAWAGEEADPLFGTRIAPAAFSADAVEHAPAAAPEPHDVLPAHDVPAPHAVEAAVEEAAPDAFRPARTADLAAFPWPTPAAPAVDPAPTEFLATHETAHLASTDWAAPSEPAIAAAPEPLALPATPSELPTPAPAPAAPAWDNNAERVAAAPPATLNHVELIERLAQALEKRRDVAPAPGEHAEGIGEIEVGPSIEALRAALAQLRGH